MTAQELYDECYETILHLSDLARRRGDLVGASHWEDHLSIIALLWRHGRAPRPATLTKLRRAVEYSRQRTALQAVA